MIHKDSGTNIINYSQLYKINLQHDYIVKVSGCSLRNLQIDYIIPTSSLSTYLRNYIDILVEIIKSQSKQLEFNGYYISYLLGQIKEKEFEEIAKRFVVKKKEIPLKHLQQKVSVLKELMGDDITPKEMAQYFQCKEESIVKVLKSLPH